MTRARRAELDLTQDQVAKKARVTPGTVRDFEKGRQSNPRSTTLAALSNALEWPSDYLEEVFSSSNDQPTDAETRLKRLETRFDQMENLIRIRSSMIALSRASRIVLNDTFSYP